MVSRRCFCGIVLAAAVSSRTWAAGQCSQLDMNGVQSCSVGLPLAQFASESFTTTQEKDNWCWAACVSSIFQWYGRDVAQERIVEKIFGGDLNSPASGPQIFEAINGYWTDDYDDDFYAEATPLLDLQYSFGNPQAAAIMSTELLEDHPLIIGTRGHAMVVTALTWVQDVYGRQQIVDLVVRDPWPDNPRRRSLSAEEFYGTNFLMQVRVD